MNTQIISICGVDGTGKTTLLQNLKNKGHLTLRSPQIHESGNFTVSKLSRSFEELSKLYDQNGDRVSKACILFLAMSLEPKAEHELISGEKKILFRERDPILDLCVYAPIYLKFLKPEDLFEPKIHLKEIEEYFKTQSALFPGIELKHLPAGLIRFFSEPTSSWIKRLKDSLKIREATQVVLLKASSELLIERMNLKHQNQKKEFHEEIGILLTLQSGFEKAGATLSPLLNFRFQILEIESGETPETTCAHLEAIL